MKVLIWIQGSTSKEIINSNLRGLSNWEEAHIWYCGSDADEVEGISILPYQDPGPDENEFIKLNYSRQYDSTVSMLKLDDFDEYDRVVKLRGDILITDVDKLRNYVLNSSPYCIHVPEFNTLFIDNIFDYRWHVSDWVYIGTPDMLRKILAKSSQVDEVLAPVEDRKFLDHWVGALTCEQAMLDQHWLSTQSFDVLVRVFSLRKIGLNLRKYNFLYFPKIDNWKPYVFVRLTCYTSAIQNLRFLNKNIFRVIMSVRNKIASRILMP